MAEQGLYAMKLKPTRDLLPRNWLQPVYDNAITQHCFVRTGAEAQTDTKLLLAKVYWVIIRQFPTRMICFYNDV